MKTNQILIRSELFIQRTKDGYFNATNLVKEWNKSNVSKPKQLGNYQKNLNTLEFIEILKSEGIEKPMISARGRGKGAGTWMHPKLFIDLAMWVSVEFKSIVIDYFLDGLIVSRNEAGDYYNEMCAQILDSYFIYYNRKPPARIFINEAHMVRNIVTNKKERNDMTEQELKQITYLQKFNTNLIKKGIGSASRKSKLSEANEIKI